MCVINKHIYNYNVLFLYCSHSLLQDLSTDDPSNTIAYREAQLKLRV